MSKVSSVGDAGRLLFAVVLFATVTALAACTSLRPAGPPGSETADQPDASAPPPAARNPLGNKARDAGATFRADSEKNPQCGGASLGEITYSDIVRLQPDQWVYLRDTKSCPQPDHRNKYFGILARKGGKLAGAEVEFDLAGVIPADRPSDLEAFCLITGPAGSPAQFEMIAVESGGYKPVVKRRLFRLKFTDVGGRFRAEVTGRANYHPALLKKDGAPADFETEAMLCKAGKDGKFEVTIADRGRHEKRNDVFTLRRGGGLMKLTVDFSPSCASDCVVSTESDYVEVVAPHCAVPAAIVKGQWRDIAALYRQGETVWASSVFEGKVGPRSTDYYCSIVYQLCATADCDRLARTPAKSVPGYELQGRKIEGIAQGAAPGKFAIASDEESRGAIDVAVAAPGASLGDPLIAVRRTADLARPVGAALSRTNPANVLAVFDLDDTLLTMTQDLGSVAWYDWQSQINKGAWPLQAPTMRVSRNTSELLVVQGILYRIGDMRPTQRNTGKLIADLQNGGVATYVLTARGPDFSDATRRELGDAGLRFTNAPPCTGALCSHRGVIPKDHPPACVGRRLDPGEDSLKVCVARQLDDAAAKLVREKGEINIDHGVMMVSGLDKGVMLRLLLANLPGNRSFDSVVFVDDSLKNVIAVARQASQISQDTLVYHYTRHVESAEAFFDEKKDAIANDRQDRVARAWTEIRNAACAHEWHQWCAFSADP